MFIYCNFFRSVSGSDGSTIDAMLQRPAIGELPVTSSTLPISGVYSRGGDARIALCVGEAGTCGGCVFGITGVRETGAWLLDGARPKFATIKSCLIYTASCIAAMLSHF